MKPRLLDLYAGAGGAARGYQLAGFHVTGVDHRPQPRYAGDEFLQVDALTYITAASEYWVYDAIHASPPCQAYTWAAHYQRTQGATYPDLIAATRELLNATGLPWVIENVPGAPMRADYRICGCQVGLDEIRRVRWFETSWHGYDLAPPCHHTALAITVTGHGTTSRSAQRIRGLPNPTVAQIRRAMGIDWMSRDELSQAIPPAFTRYVGEQMLAHLNHNAPAAATAGARKGT